MCDAGERLATPVGVVTQWNRERLAEQITEQAKKLGAQHIVVGLPRNMDGSLGESAQAAQNLAERISQLSGLSYSMRDERGTTVTAHKMLQDAHVFGKNRKAATDALAATIILEEYLQYRKTLAKKDGVADSKEEEL